MGGNTAEEFCCERGKTDGIEAQEKSKVNWDFSQIYYLFFKWIYYGVFVF